jgi:conjugal transfer pilus assembly protein TraF
LVKLGSTLRTWSEFASRGNAARHMRFVGISPKVACTFGTIGLILMGTSTLAETPFKLDLCGDARTKGWAYYCAPPVPVEEPAPEAQEPVVVIAAPPVEMEPTEPEKGPATQAILAFRAEVDEIKYRAVLDPTPENVQAYMEIQKQIGDQAGVFTETWQRVLYGTPHLDANTEYPLASAGIGVYQEQLKAARQAALERTAATRGILYIFEGSEACGICRVQGEVLQDMRARYGIEILAVSKDGGGDVNFPDAVVDAGQLKAMGLEDFPAPTIALIDPNSKQVDVIGSGLLTADQVLERVYVVTEVPEGQRY